MLRAPWCGLSLAGLHRLTSNDDPELLIRPVRELMEERIDLLNDEDRAATARVLSVLQSLPALRASLPTITLGSWIEQVWLRMGGQACVDAAGRANLDLLWNSLDSLPHREEDLLGPALDAALRDLMALPDPDASAEHGVQLMTIHKSKGLEFEVVIVPDLRARGSQGDARMLSWLERGLSEPDESELITEFLIAPLQPKGEERGSAKAFVDRSIRERERQEMRRLLYVAATRAREELHFFACPAYKTDTEGEMTLATADGLLATAWSALGAEISARFTAWKADRAQPEAVGAIAASTDNLLTMPGTLIQRLPVDFCATDAASTPGELADNPALQPEDLYERHEGGLVSRALGTAVHELLEHFSKLRIRQDAVSSRAVLSSLLPSIAAQIRARGLSPTEATRIAQQAVQLADAATRNNTGAWILAPHTTASSEAAWSGYIQGKLRSVQADRVFLAGPEPLSEGDSCWWIIDYKTTHAEDEDPDALLPALRERYQKQLAIYADMLRALHGSSIRIRAGLFYPRMGLFDHWPI